MRRALGLGLLLAALAATPAAAAEPTVLDFEDQTPGANVGISDNPGEVYGGRSDVILSDTDTCAQVAASGGNFGPRYLDTQSSCDPLAIRFSNRVALASLFIKSFYVPGLHRASMAQQGGITPPPPVTRSACINTTAALLSIVVDREGSRYWCLFI